MHFPTWVDLKGEDAVPDTVHHVVVNVDPMKDQSWHSLRQHIQTDGIHANDNVRPSNISPGMNRNRNSLQSPISNIEILI